MTAWTGGRTPQHAPENYGAGFMITFNQARRTQIYFSLIGIVYCRLNQGKEDESTWLPWTKLNN